MLSDEEKEALDKLSSKKNETTWNDTIRQIKREEIKDVVVTRQKYITAVLNLIEKQSKEIEELKENNKTLKNLQNDTNRLYIEMIERKNYFERELQKVVDKIKAKIEELDENGYWDFLEKRDEEKCKDILQSLLEKE